MASLNNQTLQSNQATTTRPEHHLHDTSDPLPGARGQTAIDYSPENLERLPSTTWKTADPSSVGQTMQSGQNAFNSDRPLDVQPTAAGGVAVGGQADLPEGKAKTMDKVIGKTQKVMGKVLDNMELHEKGELRESGGKAAAMGQARAPHD